MLANPLMPEAAAVTLSDVSKIYGQHQVHAVADVSLEIKPGEFVALMGPSGCGKSTLLNLIGAIDKPSAGSIRVSDVEIGAQSDDELTRLRANKIGYIFQFFNLLSTLTVEENVLLPLDLTRRHSGAEAAKQVQTLLARVGMAERARFYPSQLSGGEMQRTAIARALVHRPQLILADEPTGNLDTENGRNILDLLKSINQELGPTVVMATHSEEAASYAVRTICMRDGRIV